MIVNFWNKKMELIFYIHNLQQARQYQNVIQLRFKIRILQKQTYRVCLDVLINQKYKFKEKFI